MKKEEGCTLSQQPLTPGLWDARSDGLRDEVNAGDKEKQKELNGQILHSEGLCGLTVSA